MSTIDDAIRAAQSAAAIRACTPVYGSCALLSGHRGPHHGYRDNVAAIVELAVKDALAALLPAEPSEAMIAFIDRLIDDDNDMSPNEMYAALRAHLGLAP